MVDLHVEMRSIWIPKHQVMFGIEELLATRFVQPFFKQSCLRQDCLFHRSLDALQSFFVNFLVKQAPLTQHVNHLSVLKTPMGVTVNSDLPHSEKLGPGW